jgi:hypothetical protein
MVVSRPSAEWLIIGNGLDADPDAYDTHCGGRNGGLLLATAALAPAAARAVTPGSSATEVRAVTLSPLMTQKLIPSLQ